MKKNKKKTKNIVLFSLLMGLLFYHGTFFTLAIVDPNFNPETGTMYTDPQKVDPQKKAGSPTTTAGQAYQNQEKIPGSQPTSDFPTYMKQIIGFGYAVIGILAMFMICVGAYQYLMAAGNIGKVDSAKQTIGSALLGLVLGLASFIILRTINPDLVSLKGPQLTGLTGSGARDGGTGTGGTTPGGGGLPGPYSSNAPAEIQQKAREYAAQYGIPESIALSMMAKESANNPNAVSPAGAQGLLQLMPGTGREYGVTDPFNVDQNLNAGYHYLSDMYSKYGDWGQALAAYNMGPGAFDKYMNGNRNMPRETTNYVNSIMGYCNFCPQT